MSPVSICTTPSVVQRYVILFLVLYIPAVFATSVGRRGRAPLSFATLPLALAPLFASLCGAWLLVVRLIESLAIGGRGRSASAAGLAEAEVTLGCGALVAGVMSAIAAARGFADDRRNGNAAIPSPSRRYRAFQLLMSSLALILVIGECAQALQIVSTSRDYSPRYLSASIGAVLIAAVATLVSGCWLIWARKGDAALHGTRATAVAVIAFILCGAIFGVSWYLARSFARVAIFG
jgi:hypothetical protein